jgi:putative ABC transport system substrate-binding protein
MLTRRFLLTAGAALATIPAKAAEDAGSFRVGRLLASGEVKPWIDAFVEEMAKLGYATGKNWRFETVDAGGDMKRLPDAAAEILALHPDVILVTSTPTLMALANQHATIPVVFVIGIDPMSLGVVQSLSHPGVILPGCSTLGPSISRRTYS